MAAPKLEWMYRNSSEVVDNEEYLLGRPVDKAFEQSSLGNEIEKDCLPTPIFSNTSSNIQVDVVRKLKEDPLEIIRQQEIERRKQILKNPVKLKKLQNMLSTKKSEDLTENTPKKKKKSMRMDENSQDIDSVITSKCITLMKKHGIKSIAELCDFKVHKKKKRGKKTSKQISDNESEDKRNKKKRGVSSSSSESEYEKVTKHKKKKTTLKKKYAGSSDSDTESEEKSQSRRHRPVGKSQKHRTTRSSTESSSDEDYTRTSKNQRKSSKSSSHEHNNQSKRHKQKRDKSSDSDTDSDCKSLRKCDKGKKPQSSQSPTERKKQVFGDSRMKEYSSSNIKRPVQAFKNLTSHDKRSSALSENEREKKLKEMMENAKWRDEVRVKNVTRYKKEDAEEQKKVDKEYNEDFIRKQMSIATSSGSVEARIKSNINNIQRSKFSMNENFARR